MIRKRVKGRTITDYTRHAIAQKQVRTALSAVRSENLIRPRAKLKRNDMVVIDNLPAHKVLA
jgi:hypothetical protein